MTYASAAWSSAVSPVVANEAWTLVSRAPDGRAGQRSSCVRARTRRDASLPGRMHAAIRELRLEEDCGEWGRGDVSGG